jgi:transcriptional regulator with XRE-family HTH domain
MTTTKLFFHSNVRFLRERKKLTQEDIAQKLGLTRVKLAALEGGRTENPTAADLIKFSEYFKVSIDSLFKVDISKLSELKLRELEAGNDVYMTGSQIRVLAITVDKTNKENIEYVPVKAKAGYRKGYADPEFLAALPKITKPNLPTGTHRTFPITGDSMLPIPEDSDITTSYVQDWKKIKPDTPCIVILKEEQDFVFKLITILEGELLLKSLNTAYKPYTVPVSEVMEIWRFLSYETRDFPEPQTDVQDLARAVRDMQKQLIEIKDRK